MTPDAHESERVRVPVSLPAGEACTACIAWLDRGVDALAGVGSVQVDPSTSEVEVVFDPAVVSREDLVSHIERLGHEVGSAVAHASWRVTGLDCPDCARTVDVSVSRLDGVLSASLNFASGVLFVEYDSAEDPRQEIERFVAAMDYGLERIGDAEEKRSETGDRVGTDSRQASKRLRRRADVATWVGGGLIVLGWAVGWLAARLASPAFEGSWVFSVLTAAPFAVSIVVGGGMIFRRALSSARARIPDMNVLMTIAVVGAACIGQWAEASTVVFLFSVGGMLESRSLERTRRSIRDLMDLTPPTTHVMRGGREAEVAPAEVGVGERVVIRPGERLPLDGRIAEGSSAIDEAAITGESVPSDKGPGDIVWAGTLNTYAPIVVEVTAPAEDTTLARIIFLVEEAQAQRAPFQSLVDRFTRWYTPAVTLLAVLLALVPPGVGVLAESGALGVGPLGFDASFSTWFYRALVLLVVSCPCALVISTPVAIVSAITRASRDGILVKGGAFLEIAPRIRALAFDKTGTLTRGAPEVAEVVALDGSDRARVVQLAAALERGSTHPLAGAVVREAERTGRLDPTGQREDSGVDAVGARDVGDIRETAGRGMSGRLEGTAVVVGSLAFAEESGCSVDGALEHVERIENEGRTALVLGVNGRIAGILAVADAPRENAARVVGELKGSGFDSVTMLTGDNERVASAISRRTGLDGYDARLLPEHKVDAVRALRERFGAVAMVGDGINDAPALAAADLGIAMGAAGSDTALETADIALMSDDLSALPRFFDLGRRTVANIRQNVVVSVTIKLAVLVAAVLGYAPLWLAVFADTGVALLVIINGLRLLRPSASVARRSGFGSLTLDA